MRISKSLVVWTIIATLVAPWTTSEASAQNQGFVFGRLATRVELDGELVHTPITYLEATKDHEAVELIYVNDVLLSIASKGVYRFTRSPEHDGRVFLLNADGTKRVVGIRLGSGISDCEDEDDGLGSLTDEQIHGLWGITLECWHDKLSERLRHIDPGRAVVSLDGSVNKSVVPPLPLNLQFLNIDDIAADLPVDYRMLARLSKLRYFSGWFDQFDMATIAANRDLQHLWLFANQLLHSERLADLSGLIHFDGCTDRIDLATIGANKRLQYLSLEGTSVEHVEALGDLSALSILNLRQCKGVDSSRFLKKMDSLRILNLSGTAVTDLSPLRSRDRLENLNVWGAPVTKLPTGRFEALKTANFISTSLTDESVAQFRKANPNCRVIHRWSPAFQELVPRTTKLGLRTGGWCYGTPEKDLTVFQSSDACEIDRILSKLSLDEQKGSGSCICCGSITFEFYNGDELLAEISLIHGESLRWRDSVWPGDARLTAESQAAVKEWLDELGVNID